MANLMIITNGNYFAKLILDPVMNVSRHQVKGIILVKGDYKGNAGFKAVYKLAKAMNFQYFAYKLFIYFIFKILKIIYPNRSLEVKDLISQHNIPYLVVNKINTEEALNFIKQFKIDIIVSVSCPQRIGKPILNLPDIQKLNIHSSLLPKYAGLAPYFWVLANGESRTGTTVHVMTKTFDLGNIIVQKELTISPQISVFNLFRELSLLGSCALLESMDLVAEGFIGYPQDKSCRSYYSHPDDAAYQNLKKKGYSLMKREELVNILFHQYDRENPQIH